MACFCFFAVLMFIVSNYVELARLKTTNSRLKTQIETLKGDEQSLKAKYEQTFNLVDIETKAKGELGMIKMDKTHLNYIELSNPDKLSTAKAKEEVPQIVQNAIKSFNIVVEYLN